MFSRFSVLFVWSVTALAGQTALAQLNWNDPHAVARAAADANPAVRRVEAQAEAARERVIQVSSYPNPMVMGGVQNLPIDVSRDEMTMYMVGASQTIPAPARRQALRSSAELDVRRIESEAASLRVEAERDALFAWYDIAASDSKLPTLRQVGVALDGVVAAVRARYEAGSAIQADIVRAQLQRGDVEHQILSENGRRRAAAARLLALLGRDLTGEVPELQVAHAMDQKGISEPREVPDSHPALAGLRSEVERRERDIQLARLVSRPDVNIEASYGVRPQHTDMVTIVARVELPLRKKTLIQPRIREAIAERDAAAERIEELRRRLLADVGVAYEAHAEATKQIAFHEQTLVPQSKLAVDSTRAAFEAGKTTLDAVLAVQASFVRLELEYFDYLAQHMKAVTDFDAIRRGARSGSIAGMPATQRSGMTTASVASGATEMK